MSQWKKVVSQEDDPLLNYIGQPILGKQNGGAVYRGRIIVELWETSQADQVAYSLDFPDGDSQVLLQRTLKALASKIQQQNEYKPLE
jgi:hypothetical protein